MNFHYYDEPGCFAEETVCANGDCQNDGLFCFNSCYYCPDCIETVRARRVEELRGAVEAGSRIATGEAIVQRAADRAICEMRAWLEARAATLA